MGTAVLGLLISLVIVVLGAEALVRGASRLAIRMGLSPLFVGLTIVGFGTSSPELAASLVATLRGVNDVSLGNVIGSNIFNVAVIAGVAALVRPIEVQLRAVRRDLYFAIAAATVPWAGLAFGATIPRSLGMALLFVLITYIFVAYRAARRGRSAEQGLAETEVERTLGGSLEAPRRAGPWVDPAMVLLGLGLLVFGSRVFVTSAIVIARALGVSDLFVGLTIVAAGTSLPELVTSVVAALRRSPDIALGNIIGSNIINVFGILGLCAVIHPLPVGRDVLLIDVPVMLGVTLALLPIMKSGGVISRGEGGVLLGCYAVYVGVLIQRSS